MGTSQIKNVALAVKRVVHTDLHEHKISLRNDFSLQTFLEESGLKKHIHGNRIDTTLLSKFSSNIASQAEEHWTGTSGAFEEFMGQLLHLMRTRDKMDSLFEQEQVLSAIDEVKLEMLKLLMMEPGLSLHEKTLIQDALPKDIKSLDDLINKGLVQNILR